MLKLGVYILLLIYINQIYKLDYKVIPLHTFTLYRNLRAISNRSFQCLQHQDLISYWENSC